MGGIVTMGSGMAPGTIPLPGASGLIAPAPAPERTLGGVTTPETGGSVGGCKMGPGPPAGGGGTPPTAVATWPGDSGCGTSATSVLAIAPATPEGTLGVMITGANGGIPGGAKA